MPSSQDGGARSVSIDELSDTLAASMRNPAPPQPGVCPVCWTFDDPVRPACSGCHPPASNLDVVVPISYAPRYGQLAAALYGYKNEALPRTRAHHGYRLAAILWRFLATHEQHVASAAGADAFDVVTVVPSKTTEKDDARKGLRAMVGQVVGHTSDRFDRVLRPTDRPHVGRYFDAARYAADPLVAGRSVLLIDDTWVSGTSAQSAAAALRAAGARHVACVVIGRWLIPTYGGEWGTSGERWSKLPREFDWRSCAVEPAF